MVLSNYSRYIIPKIRNQKLTVQNHFSNFSQTRKYSFSDELKNKKAYKVGDTAVLEKRFSQEDVDKFAEVSLDNNDIHSSKEAAIEAGFIDGPIIHGVLGLGLLSAVCILLL